MPQDQVKLAFDAFQAGRVKDATAICEKLLNQEPDQAAALMLMGLIADRENRFDDAVLFLTKAARLESNPWTLVVLSSSLGRLFNPIESLKYAEEVVAIYPDFPQGHLQLANALHGVKRFDEALIRAQNANRLTPHSISIELRLGCIYSRLGDYENAMRHFGNAERLMPTMTHCRLIDYRRELWEQIKPDSEILIPQTTSSPNEDAIVLTSCDARYFYKYGEAFVNSFAQNAAHSKRLHLHILDPDRNFDEYLHELLQKVGLRDVSITTENSPVSTAANEKMRKTFYSCARFFQINQLLQRYQVSIVCFDIDTIFESSIDSLLTLAAGKDVGLMERDPPDSPWLDVVANAFVANFTPGAGRYFAAVCNFIRHAAERGEWFWYLDQISLHCVLKMMERYDRPPRVGRLPQENGPVWHIGHAHSTRLKEPRYDRYRLNDLKRA